MSDNVVPFPRAGGGPPVQKPELQVNTELIERLEAMLTLTRTGQIRAVAVVYVHADGAVSVGWTQSPEGSYHQLVSGAASLMTRLSGP